MSADFISKLFAGGGEMGARMRACDWASTKLGVVENWPASLRSALSICLGSRFPIAIYWGPELVLLYNDAWSPIPGTKHPWALGRPAIEVWPEIWTEIGPAFEQVFATGEATYNEEFLLFMHRHGYTEECWFSYTFTPIRGESGAVEGVFNAVIETTFRVIEQRRTRVLRDLGAREAAVRSADEACAIAAEVLAADGHDVPFCALYLANSDHTEAHLAGVSGLAPSSPLCPKNVRLDQSSSSLLGLASRAGRIETIDGLQGRFGPTSSGPWPEPVTCALVAPIVTAASAPPAGYLIVGVSPRRAVDDEYRQFVERAATQVASAIANATALAAERQRAEELAALDRAKTTFFSNVSHELRTPLTLILGPTRDMLAGTLGALPPDVREQLELQERNAVRLQKLVNSLLDLSRLEAGRVQINFEPVDLAAITRDLAEAFRIAIERAGLALKLDIEPIQDTVFVDRDMWEQIVLNLLSNALKFTFEGTIEVSLRSYEGFAELRVKDTGVGVAADQLPRLFERFHRVEGAKSRTHEGTGIGLALVQELVKLHGGVVEVSSELGEGTAFTVSVPTGSRHLTVPTVAPDSQPASTSLGAAPFVEEALRWLPDRSEAHSIPPPIRERDDGDSVARTDDEDRARILVADDNADMREYVRRHLLRYWDVEAVSDGIQALEAARERPPDLILTDVMMPGLSGFALLAELRADPRTRAIPVIMLSARAGEEARVEGLEAGAEDYLAKPFSARELLARVRTHLEIARLRNAVRTERDQLRALLGQVPAIVNFLHGPDLIWEYIHPLAKAALADRDVLGKPLLEVLPEFRDQEYPALLRRVVETGERIEGFERLVRLPNADGTTRETYWNFVYLPVRYGGDRIEGVMTFDIEVTSQVIARRRADESRAEHQRLIQQLEAGIAQTDLEGRFVFTNERYQELVGRTDSELSGLRMQDITHPDDLPANMTHFARLVADGTPFMLQKRYVRPDGSSVWVHNSVSRIDDAEGRPHGVAAVAIDVTEQRALEARAALLTERLSTAQRAAKVGIFDWNLTTDTVHWSPELYDLLGVARDSVQSTSEEWTRRTLPDDREHGWRGFQAATAAKLEYYDIEVRIVRPDGAPRWLRLSNQLFYDAHGNATRLVGAAIDIDELKHAVASERTAREQAERAARFSEMFVGILGHDLRNPLGAITAAANLLEMRADNERIATPVSRIVASANRMDRMIGQLLDFTRIRVGQGLPLDRVRVDLSQLCRAIIDEIEPVYRCPIELGSVGDVTGFWDRDRLSQLFSNLAANACQHGTAGSVRTRLDGTARDVVRLEVINGGVIPEELLPVIFEPLRTSERHAKRAGSSGLGLGLFISQQIARAHDGAIHVESDEQRGTRFVVTLPRQRDAGEP